MKYHMFFKNESIQDEIVNEIRGNILFILNISEDIASRAKIKRNTDIIYRLDQYVPPDNEFGSSTVKMDDFSVNDAKLQLSVSSDCIVNIDGEMDVQASGSSKVKYCGKGELGSIEASGFSKVKRM